MTTQERNSVKTHAVTVWNCPSKHWEVGSVRSDGSEYMIRTFASPRDANDYAEDIASTLGVPFIR